MLTGNTSATQVNASFLIVRKKVPAINTDISILQGQIMTKQHSSSNWLDVLYMSVRNTAGGVADAARFLAERRGKSIHPESLRSKLIGKEGESLTIEFAELLTEWMDEKANPHAKDWLLALNSQYGFNVIPREEKQTASSIVDIMVSYLDVSSENGHLSETLTKIIDDGQISKKEAAEANALLLQMIAKVGELSLKINGASK